MVTDGGSAHLRIDAHQHFWRVSRGDYSWMPSSGSLASDFLPSDLVVLNRKAQIDGTVLIQAAPTLRETEYMLGLADADGPVSILGVVGWVDLDSTDTEALEHFAKHPKFVGVRPMIQDIADEEWILRPRVIDNLRLLTSMGLTLDLLCRTRHLQNALQALIQVPELKVVVDHLAKPDYRHVDVVWLDLVGQLAKRPNTYCKLAGLVSEVDPGWTASLFKNHFNHIVDLFHADRVMIGTDWPVHTTVATHLEVVELANNLIADLDEGEQRRMWSGSAIEFYGLRC